MRPLRSAAPPVLALSGRGWTVRSLLRFLRLRDGAGHQPAHLVAAVVACGAAPGRPGSYLRDSAGAGRSLRPVQPVPTLHAEAVPPQVVMPAGRAHQPSRWVRLQPALVLTAVPHSVFGTEHPSPALVVEHGEVAHRNPERPRLQVSSATLFDEVLVANLGIRERIYRHAREYYAVRYRGSADLRIADCRPAVGRIQPAS